jgi:hypothetical protein
MAKQDDRRPKGDTGMAEIYTADKGNPPADPDMGSVKGAKPVAPSKPVKKMANGGSASARADGCAQRGKTRGKIV